MFRTLFAGLGAALLTAGAAAAQQQPDWQYPVINYGPVVPIPDATAERESGEPYRVVFNITQDQPGDGRVSNDLALVGRFVNLLELSGMDPSASDIVAVVHAAATPAVLQDEAYGSRYGSPNPNAQLIAELEDSGVEVVVCGQALAGAGLALDEVLEPVEVSISAMTEIASRQMQGYALMP